MGKLSQAGSTGGGMSALERLAAKAQADLPTGQPELEQRPRPNVQPQTAQDPGINLQQAEELPASQTHPTQVNAWILCCLWLRLTCW